MRVMGDGNKPYEHLEFFLMLTDDTYADQSTMRELTQKGWHLSNAEAFGEEFHTLEHMRTRLVDIRKRKPDDEQWRRVQGQYRVVVKQCLRNIEETLLYELSDDD